MEHDVVKGKIPALALRMVQLNHEHEVTIAHHHTYEYLLGYQSGTVVGAAGCSQKLKSRYFTIQFMLLVYNMYTYSVNHNLSKKKG